MSTRPMTPAPCLRRWLALALLGTAFFMVILDGTIVYVALPQIAGDLEFSIDGVQWVMSAYLLCFGGLLLLGGRCADLLGRRRVFMVGVGLFVCSSLLCGLAWSPAFRHCRRRGGDDGARAADLRHLWRAHGRLDGHPNNRPAGGVSGLVWALRADRGALAGPA